METWQSIIKQKMTETGETQESIAEKLNVSQGSIAHWLSGRRKPDTDIIAKLMDAVGLKQVILNSDGTSVTIPTIKDTNFEMSKSIADWVKYARSKTGFTRSEFAKEINITTSNLTAYEEGLIEPNFGIMTKIAAFTGIELPAQNIKEATSESSVIIQQLSVTAECGSGDYSDYFELKGGLSFSKEWLKNMGIDPAYCYVIYAKGWSMHPTLQDGQAVLIDTSQKTPIENKVYLIARDQNGLIMKRLLRNSEASWIYVSDNPDKTIYPTMYAFENDQIIGRVVWTGGTAGL